MKVVKSMLVTVLLLLLTLPANVSAEQPITVSIDGESVNLQVPPIIREGKTLVPFRPIFEKLGLKITWDQKTQSVQGKKDGLNIQLKVGDKQAIVNGKLIILEVAPKMINGTVFVPLRFIGESADGEVTWIEASKQVSIIVSVDMRFRNAVLDKNVPKVKELLKQGADPNYVDVFGSFPLAHAVWKSNNSEMVKVLLENEADVNQKDGLGKTPLHMAIYFTEPEYVKLLIAAGANLNAKDNHGKTPLD